MARQTTVVRARLARILALGLERTTNRTRRERLWRLVRRFDDADDTVSRAVMRRVLDVEVGRLTYGAFRLDGSIIGGTRIGSFCSIAPGVRLGGVEHPLEYVSTHPFLWLANRGFVPRDDRRFADFRRPVVVEDDVWIGANALVAGGVRIGRGAVVGAGSVVRHDVAPYSIVAGVPAREIGRRFEPEVADRLGGIEWTSWPKERIKEELPAFYDVSTFVARHGGAA